MADDHTRDELAQLRAELAAQEARFTAQISALQAERHRPRRRLPRRFLPLALVALLVVLTPLATFAAAPFNDLTGGVHDANIGLLYDAGITKGCVPNVSYCPTANVTREEMASFLARTAGLGTNPPVVNAATAVNAQNATNATNAQNATNADNANTVGGYAASGLNRVALSSNPNNTGGGTSQTLRTVTLTVPGPATQLVSLQGYFTVNGTFSGCPCYYYAHVRDAGSGAKSNDFFGRIAASGVYDQQTLSLGWVFPAAPGTHTYELVAGFVGTGQNYNSQTLIATTHPFGSTGGAGTLEVPDAPDRPAPSAPGQP